MQLIIYHPHLSFLFSYLSGLVSVYCLIIFFTIICRSCHRKSQHRSSFLSSSITSTDPFSISSINPITIITRIQHTDTTIILPSVTTLTESASHGQRRPGVDTVSETNRKIAVIGSSGNSNLILALSETVPRKRFEYSPLFCRFVALYVTLYCEISRAVGNNREDLAFKDFT